MTKFEINGKIKEKFFTPSDFATIQNMPYAEAVFDCARVANEKLESKMGPKVYYGISRDITKNPNYWASTENDENFHEFTHSAHIFNMQPMHKPECKHIPEVFSKYIRNGKEIEFVIPVCSKCGVEICAIDWKTK